MNPPAPSRPVIGDPFYPRLKTYILAYTGLAYYSDRDEDFAAVIDRRLAELEMDTCAAYLQLLESQTGQSELNVLIAQLTVGETYFFRHQEQFDALRDLVLPDILSRKQSSRQLRIWSAGCATGAEPYSIAILLKRHFEAQLQWGGWQVSIIGTDINQEYLRQARKGLYAEWALRSTPEDLRLACFSRSGNLWEIASEYKEVVSFQYHNLVKDPFPAAQECEGFDLIVCRNVTIYFDQEVTRAIVAQFYQSLDRGGWLVVGHTEPSAETFRAFKTVNADGVTLYCKSERALAPSAAPGITPEAAEPSLAVAPVKALPPANNGHEKKRSPLSEEDLSEMRRLANHGDWESAARHCRSLLSRNSLNPVVHFYHALVLDHMGLLAEAERSYRQAIYLDRNFVLAHYHLGLTLQRENNVPQAARCFENVLTLLTRVQEEHILAEGDDISPASLRELTRLHLEILRSS